MNPLREAIDSKRKPLLRERDAIDRRLTSLRDVEAAADALGLFDAVDRMMADEGAVQAVERAVQAERPELDVTPPEPRVASGEPRPAPTRIHSPNSTREQLRRRVRAALTQECRPMTRERVAEVVGIDSAWAGTLLEGMCIDGLTRRTILGDQMAYALPQSSQLR